MKKLLFPLLFAILAFSACEKNYAYNFIDQDLKGRILDGSWTYTEGKASLSGDNLVITIVGSSQDSSDICATPISGDQVLFQTSNQVGLKELGLTSQTVTLFDAETFFNCVAVKGALEIISIDTSGLVVGKMDAYFDDENYVNGNFSLSFCP